MGFSTKPVSIILMCIPRGPYSISHRYQELLHWDWPTPEGAFPPPRATAFKSLGLPSGIPGTFSIYPARPITHLRLFRARRPPSICIVTLRCSVPSKVETIWSAQSTPARRHDQPRGMMSLGIRPAPRRRRLHVRQKGRLQLSVESKRKKEVALVGPVIDVKSKFFHPPVTLTICPYKCSPSLFPFSSITTLTKPVQEEDEMQWAVPMSTLSASWTSLRVHCILYQREIALGHH